MTFFAESEFLCRCGRPECDALKAPARALVVMLEIMRGLYGEPLVVTSGLRCPAWNAHEHGEPDSEHLTGEGADLACRRSGERWAMLEAARHAGFLRLGLGRDFLHVGMGPEPRAQRVLWTYYGSPR